MAVKRVIKRKAPPPDLQQVVNEYCLQRSMRERSAYHENKLKAGLMEVIATSGMPDGEESQHLKIDLPTPVEFTTFKGEHGTKKTVVAIQRQKREGSMRINEDRAFAFLNSLKGARKELFNQCVTTVQVLNEDALLAANFEKTISDDELKALYDTSDPTYAFQLITE